MKRLMIVRHGESEWNAGLLLQGQADIDLSDKGRNQARALSQTVRALNPDRVIASDLARARETAHLLGFQDARTTQALREIDVGDWTGRPIGTLVANDPEDYRGWRAGTFTPPGGEAWADFAHRTAHCVKHALADCERLLVVCHGGVIRALLETLIGLPPKKIIPVGPASLTILAERPNENGAMRLEVFNFSPGGPILDAPD